MSLQLKSPTNLWYNVKKTLFWENCIWK